MTLEELFEISWNKDNQKMERWFYQMVASNQRYKRRLVSSIAKELSTLELSKDGVYIRPTVPNINELNRIARAMPELFFASGSGQIESEMMSIINKRLKSADTIWKDMGLDGLELGRRVYNLPIVAEQLTYLQNGVLEGNNRAQQEAARVVLQARQNIEGNFNQTMRDLRVNLSSKAGIAPQYAGAIANTSLFAIDRGIRKEQAQMGGLDKGKYMGPNDKVTRPFCQQHVGRVESYEYWDTVPNGTTLLPVTIYGGAWRCRHNIVPYSDDWANIEVG